MNQTHQKAWPRIFTTAPFTIARRMVRHPVVYSVENVRAKRTNAAQLHNMYASHKDNVNERSRSFILYDSIYIKEGGGSWAWGGTRLMTWL